MAFDLISCFCPTEDVNGAAADLPELSDKLETEEDKSGRLFVGAEELAVVGTETLEREFPAACRCPRAAVPNAISIFRKNSSSPDPDINETPKGDLVSSLRPSDSFSSGSTLCKG